MSNELRFRRPGRIEIIVAMSAGARLYVSILQLTGRDGGSRYQHLATAYAINPVDCELVDHEGTWALDAGETTFHFKPEEARQIQKRFGLKVRHFAATEAAS